MSCPSSHFEASVSLLAIINASRADRKAKDKGPARFAYRDPLPEATSRLFACGGLKDRQPVRFVRNSRDDLFDLTVEFRVVRAIPTEDRTRPNRRRSQKETLGVAPEPPGWPLDRRVRQRVFSEWNRREQHREQHPGLPGQDRGPSPLEAMARYRGLATAWGRREEELRRSRAVHARRTPHVRVDARIYRNRRGRPDVEVRPAGRRGSVLSQNHAFRQFRAHGGVQPTCSRASSSGRFWPVQRPTTTWPPTR